MQIQNIYMLGFRFLLSPPKGGRIGEIGWMDGRTDRQTDRWTDRRVKRRTEATVLGQHRVVLVENICRHGVLHPSLNHVFLTKFEIHCFEKLASGFCNIL